MLKQRVNDGSCDKFYELFLFLECQKISFLLPTGSFEKDGSKLVLKTSLVLSSDACRFPSSRDTMHSQRTRLNFIGQDWMKSLLHLRANNWNFWKREILCAQRQKYLFASNVLSQKILKKWIHYLHSNRVNCLFVAASQSKTSINDRKEQILHLETCQLPLINISPKFALMKQVVLKLDRTESTIFSNSNKIKKFFWIASLFTWFVEGLPLIHNVVIYRINDTQYLHLEHTRDF